ILEKPFLKRTIDGAERHINTDYTNNADSLDSTVYFRIRVANQSALNVEELQVQIIFSNMTHSKSYLMMPEDSMDRNIQDGKDYIAGVNFSSFWRLSPEQNLLGLNLTYLYKVTYQGIEIATHDTTEKGVPLLFSVFSNAPPILFNHDITNSPKTFELEREDTNMEYRYSIYCLDLENDSYSPPSDNMNLYLYDNASTVTNVGLPFNYKTGDNFQYPSNWPDDGLRDFSIDQDAPYNWQAGVKLVYRTTLPVGKSYWLITMRDSTLSRERRVYYMENQSTVHYSYFDSAIGQHVIIDRELYPNPTIYENWANMKSNFEWLTLGASIMYILFAIAAVLPDSLPLHIPILVTLGGYVVFIGVLTWRLGETFNHLFNPEFCEQTNTSPFSELTSIWLFAVVMAILFRFNIGAFGVEWNDIAKWIGALIVSGLLEAIGRFVSHPAFGVSASIAALVLLDLAVDLVLKTKSRGEDNALGASLTSASFVLTIIEVVNEFMVYTMFVLFILALVIEKIGESTWDTNPP
ncbi:MAG: hypothetical protein Q6373_007030, partial [Candidatus Sigynarchaeota archaeon]